MAPSSRNRSGVFTPGTLLEERAKRGVRPGEDPELDHALAEMRANLKPGEDLLYYDPYHRRDGEAPPGERVYVPPTTLPAGAAPPALPAEKIVIVETPAPPNDDSLEPTVDAPTKVRRPGARPRPEPTWPSAHGPSADDASPAGIPLKPWKDPRTVLTLGLVMTILTGLCGILFVLGERERDAAKALPVAAATMATVATPTPLPSATPAAPPSAAPPVAASAAEPALAPSASVLPSSTAPAPRASAPPRAPSAPSAPGVPTAPSPKTTSGEVHGAPKF